MLCYFLFLKIFIYLAASGLSCSMWDLHCSMWDLLLQCTGSSLWRVVSSVQALQLWRVGSRTCGLSSCGMWAPECKGSVVAEHGLSSCGAWA